MCIVTQFTNHGEFVAAKAAKNHDDAVTIATKLVLEYEQKYSFGPVESVGQPIVTPRNTVEFNYAMTHCVLEEQEL